MISYLFKYYNKFFEASLQHIEITLVTIIISLIISTILSYLLINKKRISEIICGTFSIIYSIPSLALFAILIPIFGLGRTTAIIVLILYNQFILLRGFLSAFKSVDNSITESATGMGLTKFQIFIKILIPLGSPVIIGALRLSVISTIGISTIAATINEGGLGKLLFEGLSTNNMNKMILSAIFISFLSLISNSILLFLQKYFENKFFIKV